jgi:hypothetical protein
LLQVCHFEEDVGAYSVEGKGAGGEGGGGGGKE